MMPFYIDAIAHATSPTVNTAPQYHKHHREAAAAGSYSPQFRKVALHHELVVLRRTKQSAERRVLPNLKPAHDGVTQNSGATAKSPQEVAALKRTMSMVDQKMVWLDREGLYYESMLVNELPYTGHKSANLQDEGNEAPLLTRPRSCFGHTPWRFLTH